MNEAVCDSDLLGSKFDLSDSGRVHQGAWPLQRVDDALPLWRQTHIMSRRYVKGRVDAVLEVLRRRDLQPSLLPAAEHQQGDEATTQCSGET